MKKLISILLAAAMLLSLTACGSTAADSSRCERRAFVFMSVDMRFSECRSVFPRSVAVLFGHAEDSHAFLTLFCGDDGDAARQGHRMVPERDGRAVEQA